jgi:hypothetical protein
MNTYQVVLGLHRQIVCLGSYYNMMPTHVKTNHGCHELLLKQTSERTFTFWDFRWPPYSYISSSKTIYMYLFIRFPPIKFDVVVWKTYAVLLGFFCRSLFIFLPFFSFRHCIVCPSIYHLFKYLFGTFKHFSYVILPEINRYDKFSRIFNKIGIR